MGPVVCPGMDIAERRGSWQLQTVQRRCAPLCGQGLLGSSPAPHTGAQAGQGHPHPRLPSAPGDRQSRHRHAKQGKARGGLLLLVIGSRQRRLKTHRQQQLPRAQCGAEQALKEVIGGDLSLAGQQRSAQRQHASGPAAGRVVVGQRPAQRANRTHLLIGNASGQRRQHGAKSPHRRGLRDAGMGLHGTNMQPLVPNRDAMQLWQILQIDELRRRAQAEPHGSQQALPAGQKPGLGLRLQQAPERLHGLGSDISKVLHGPGP